MFYNRMCDEAHCIISLFFTRSLRRQIVLPISHPEVVRTLIQCFIREEILFSPEVKELVGAAIEDSLEGHSSRGGGDGTGGGKGVSSAEKYRGDNREHGREHGTSAAVVLEGRYGADAVLSCVNRLGLLLFFAFY